MKKHLDLSIADEIIATWPKWKQEMAERILRPNPPDKEYTLEGLIEDKFKELETLRAKRVRLIDDLQDAQAKLTIAESDYKQALADIRECDEEIDKNMHDAYNIARRMKNGI